MTITLSGVASSTKWFSSFGAASSDPSTIFTVYAAPQMRVEGSDGDIMWISGR